eukprot:11176755-Lingulodinium_polyedra.AAC.1
MAMTLPMTAATATTAQTMVMPAEIAKTESLAAAATTAGTRHISYHRCNQNDRHVKPFEMTTPTTPPTNKQQHCQEQRHQ